MTIEELKAEADKLGYRILKKEKYINLSPCSCGRKKPEKWHDAIEGNKFYQCRNCGRKAPGANTDKQAKKNWNKMMEVI